MMILLTVFLLFAAPVACNFRPLVMIHGLGGHYTCFDNLTEMVKLDFPGIQTFSIDSFNKDDSWAPIIQQIVRISELVDRITQKYGNITLLGFSQGGFIARGVLQMSDNPYIHTLISISAPGEKFSFACEYMFSCFSCTDTTYLKAIKAHSKQRMDH